MLDQFVSMFLLLFLTGLGQSLRAVPIQSYESVLGGAPAEDFEGFAEGALIGAGTVPGVTFTASPVPGGRLIDNFPMLRPPIGHLRRCKSVLRIAVTR